MNVLNQQPALESSQAQQRAPRAELPSKRWLFAIFLLCLGTGLGRFMGKWLDHAPAAPPAALQQNQLASGPWGTLQVTKIAIERPDEFISVGRFRTSTNRWFFENLEPNHLRDFFSENGLTAEQQSSLSDTNRWQITADGIYVTPGEDIILGLSPVARENIYRVLSSSPANYYQRFPFIIRADEADEWFDKNGLAPATDKLIRSLLYRRGDALCFADMMETLARIPSVEEKRLIAKMFSRETTLLVKLRVEEEEDVEPLVKYWGKLGQAKDIRPLLESLARTPGGATLDIVHLLTPFARNRLYTYPFPSENPIENGRDCFWSSMNFFNAESDDRFTRFDEVKRVLQTDYYPVPGDPTFGDIIWFVDSKGMAIHSAVYIAQDFLFTKNGANSNEPWILMNLDDLLTVYAIHAPLRTVAYRLKRE